MIAEMFALMIFRFLRWNLATGHTEFIVHLQPLAEELTNIGDPGSLRAELSPQSLLIGDEDHYHLNKEDHMTYDAVIFGLGICFGTLVATFSAGPGRGCGKAGWLSRSGYRAPT